MALQLSVLDQSPIAEGMTAEEALENTVKLAQHVEQLGYKRFWVSEHHDTNSLAGSSPEVLLGHIGAKTSRIRIGSGGVMLPHYSPYKVAENFHVLAGLHPGRVDLGIGRAPGGMPRATIALQGDRRRSVDRYPEQIDDLLGYLYDALPPVHPLYGVKATPIVQSPPELWLLGSSSETAKLAADKGLPYVFAQFINGEGGEHYMRLYRDRFVPSPYLAEPRGMVAVFAICAETDEKAEWIAGSLDLSLLMIEQGMALNGTPSPEKAAAYPYSPYERKRVEDNRRRMIVGSPARVKDKLYRLSETYETEEIMLVTITYDFEDKLASFRLIAEAVWG
ncbi:LLM class flavin-dependent oxidoreductase [Geobacillus stearothermophilus]|uniref:LLM class flavin-dependent oxidoreductase n=1 Tax=Geobacillus stearothermophilus TaxID=1422 RepID=UPI0025A55A78|nr:LLM class flavin-dependent oxidoreductase [Geobacillus stearothermophilus]MED4269285.1 LLM class flavin-dependent oxidoreductase [Geobacillus stearothermophilus]MED4301892.1 LLM class flavin-dependent oxidoreductase [Geobacillus stearothermophilus]WJQ08695.1 LLM class flavin-dependent oxidoreductase [Geobacillus stearothermophilus]